MAITINHQTNDISATSGSVTIGGQAVGGGGGGGATTLDGLTDVNATSPTNGQVLIWDTAANEWQAQTPSGVTTGKAIAMAIVFG